MITGGTGSFGNAVLRKLLETDIREIRIFSRDEKKQDDMRKMYKSSKIQFYIGDVRSFESINVAMAGVDYVFHAAALKQVPSCEFFPIEAVKTNVLGTENVLNAAINNGVHKVICLSTDKAAYPINAMGMSKALMEKTFMARSRNLKDNETVICGTRYGNVIASRGSVIPLFMEQIRKGDPITITNPNMTRFMMSLDDAVELVIFAFKNGRNGDLFVQKAPSATIRTLANTIRNNLGKPEHEIKVIGTRHGEKLYETLMTREEMVKAKDLGDYYRIVADERDLNYDKYFDQGENILTSIDEYHSHNTKILSEEELTVLLKSVRELKEDFKDLQKV